MNSVPDYFGMKGFLKLYHEAKYSLCCSTLYLNSHEILVLTRTINTQQKKQQRMVLVLTYKCVHSHKERKSRQDEDSGLLRHDSVSLGERFPFFCWNKCLHLQGSRVPKECQTQGAQRTHWRSSHYIPSKCWKPHVQWHTIICLKTWIHQNNAVRNSSVTLSW